MTVRFAVLKPRIQSSFLYGIEFWAPSGDDGGDTIECVRRFSARMINCMTTNVAYNKHFL